MPDIRYEGQANLISVEVPLLEDGIEAFEECENAVEGYRHRF